MRTFFVADIVTSLLKDRVFLNSDQKLEVFSEVVYSYILEFYKKEGTFLN